MSITTRFLLAFVPVMAVLPVSPGQAQADGNVVKVFILAGQSNMEGKSKNQLFNHQATDAKTKNFFAHLRDGDKWAVRDDVFIKFLGRKGPLTIGYGSRDCTGSELEFGYLMGEHFEEPVLLVKAAWGGHSLFRLFRSPSNPPSPQLLEQELEKAKRKIQNTNSKIAKRNANLPENKKRPMAPMPTMEEIKGTFGSSYRNMMTEVKDVQGNYEEMFPQLKGKKLEIAGFYWFQGFNDQKGSAPGEYASNMKHFIEDVRKDLGVPKLPFVIAAIGTGGSKHPDDHPVMLAQMSMNEVPQFKGNVKAFRTHVLVDKAAEELYPHWKQRFDEWQKVGSDRPYHYLGSAIWYTRIGRAAGEAMLELMANQ